MAKLRPLNYNEAEALRTLLSKTLHYCFTYHNNQVIYCELKKLIQKVVFAWNGTVNEVKVSLWLPNVVQLPINSKSTDLGIHLIHLIPHVLTELNRMHAYRTRPISAAFNYILYGDVPYQCQIPDFIANLCDAYSFIPTYLQKMATGVNGSFADYERTHKLFLDIVLELYSKLENCESEGETENGSEID